MQKMIDGLTELAGNEQRTIMIGDTSTLDFMDSQVEVEGLKLSDDIEDALPRAIAMHTITASAAAKEGVAAQASALKEAIDDTPGDFKIPTDIVEKVLFGISLVTFFVTIG